jgi:hypothetical protein
MADKPGWRSAVATVALAVTLAAAPLPRAAVDRWYSNGAYALFQPTVTFASNAVPFVLLDVLLVGLGLMFAIFGVRDVLRLGWGRSFARAAIRSIVWSARAYLAFLLLWGFNYRRVPLGDRLPFDQAAITETAATRLATTTVDQLNALHAAAHAEGWLTGDTIDPGLASSFYRATRVLGAEGRVVAGRPKRSSLDWYFRRAGVAGMTDPFFLETIVTSDLLPFERPFVIAHEWSHLAGLADEGEANVAGWLTCLRGSPAHQYSGWLFMYDEALRALAARDRGTVAARLQPAPRADLRAIRDRITRQVSPRVSSAGWRVYDSYLKANRVEAGASSYDDVVRLALGLRLGDVSQGFKD